MTQKKLLTPCVGRCSTVFGDNVCRGCRRYDKEVIEWNKYSAEIQDAVWRRLDLQLDKIIVQFFPNHEILKIDAFIQSNRIKSLESASLGRKLYLVLKTCQKRPSAINDAGLGISKDLIQPIWEDFEKRMLTLAKAEYEIAHIRAERHRKIK